MHIRGVIKIELWKEIIIEKRTVETENRPAAIFIREITAEISVTKRENVRTGKKGNGKVMSENVSVVKDAFLLRIKKRPGSRLRGSGSGRESGEMTVGKAGNM